MYYFCPVKLKNAMYKVLKRITQSLALILVILFLLVIFLGLYQSFTH